MACLDCVHYVGHVFQIGYHRQLLLTMGRSIA
jgi:hypothetical protein